MSIINNDLDRLESARIVITPESDVTNKLAGGLIKRVTGEDGITSRSLYHEFREYNPQFKLFIATNHPPSVFMDEAMLRRIIMVHFNVAITPDKVDKDLIEKLRDEYPGILRWCVEGCLEWQKQGLKPPQEVKDACNRFSDEMDDLKQFIEEKVQIDPTKNYPVKELYIAYRLWCMDEGDNPVGKREFNSRMRAKGFVDKKGTGNINEWQGIAIK